MRLRRIAALALALSSARRRGVLMRLRRIAALALALSAPAAVAS